MQHTVTYVCETNSTLEKLASDMNISEEELRKLNPFAKGGAVSRGTAETLHAQ